MNKKLITVKVEQQVAEAVKAYCKAKGLVQSEFIQECIADKLEEVIDVMDIPSLLQEKTRPFCEVIAELKSN